MACAKSPNKNIEENDEDEDIDSDEEFDNPQESTVQSVKNSANPGENSVCLGFLDDADPWRLCSKFFPSKVGGPPAWLALEGLPKPTCHGCRRPLAFFCQLYLPYSDYDHCFHRTLFMFICREGECSRRNHCNGIRVYRSQLPRRNKYYSYDPPIEEEQYKDSCLSPSARDYCKLCAVCGLPGDKGCSQCLCFTYCCKEHQAIHWKEGHKLKCKQLRDTPGAAEAATKFCGLPDPPEETSFLFPEAEIIMEPVVEQTEAERIKELSMSELKEQIKMAKELNPEIRVDDSLFVEPKEDPNMNKELKKLKCQTRNRRLNRAFKDREDYHLLESVANTDKDPCFRYFTEKVAVEPDQVVRFHRSGRPLYCSAKNRPFNERIWKCTSCKQKRQFEFQIMPQMLNQLEADSVEGASIDWGVLLVYTCNCDFRGHYIEEQVIKQDFSA